MTSLNPTLSVFQQLSEMLELHLNMDKEPEQEYDSKAGNCFGYSEANRNEMCHTIQGKDFDI